jgi:serine/threonine protein kinase
MRNKLLGNRYRIVDLIGEGGMAYVYVAIDEKLGRRVAVKVLHEHMERNPEIRQRFQAEAQTISAFDHPNIVKIYDFSGDQIGRLWIVTEVIQGKNLAQYVQNLSNKWLHPVIAACIVAEICKGLSKAHESSIVHRDIKPENVMITYDGRIKLMDFGISKDLAKSSVTVTGTFMGSPSYMSPEQIRGRDVDWRSDIYSLSVLFYELVTGRLPYIGNTTHDVILKIMEGNFTHPRYLVPGIPPAYDELIIQGMSKQVTGRPQSADYYREIIDQMLRLLNFDESHIELERYARDPATFQSRLKTFTVGTATPPIPMTRLAVPTPGVPPRSVIAATLAPKSNQRQPSFAPANQNQRIETSPPTPTAAFAPIAQFATGMPQRQAILPQQRKPSASLRQNPRRRAVISVSQNRTWFSYSLSFIFIGLTCALSLWGFNLIQTRLDASNLNVSQRRENWPSNSRSASYSARQPKHPKRDGTPPRATVTAGVGAGGRAPSAAVSTPPILGTVPAQRLTEAHQRPTKTIKKSQKSHDFRPLQNKIEANKAELLHSPVDLSANKTSSETESARQRKQASAVDNTTGLETILPASLTPIDRNDQAEKQDQVERLETKDNKITNEKNDPKLTPARGKGMVIVSSQPASEVYVDGRRIGTTIDRTGDSGPLPLAPGKHSLELRRTGFPVYRRVFELATDEILTLPRVTLGNRENSNSNQLVTLTIRTNTDVAQVTLRNLNSNATQIFSLRGNSKQVQLAAGRYYLRVEHNTDAKERELSLNGNEGQLTFSAEFKK